MVREGGRKRGEGVCQGCVSREDGGVCVSGEVDGDVCVSGEGVRDFAHPAKCERSSGAG